MGSALWIAISGLNASSKQMDVIGNNIANANTMGFKAGKAYFANVLSQSLSGGASGVMQIGQGVTVADVATQFSQGSLESTTSALDLAIDGGGFFIVEDDEGSQYYTRAGAFHIDGDGFLVDVNNYRVQGYPPGTPTLGDINTRNAQSAPVASTNFSIGLNLDARTATGGTYNSSQTVFDSLGAAHTLAVTYMKTEGDGQWGMYVTLDGDAPDSQNYSGLSFDGLGNLEKVYSSTMGSPTGSGSGTASAVLAAGHNGQIYQTGSLVLQRDSVNAWSVHSTSDYPNASVTGYGVTNVDDTLLIDLDGFGGADITVTLGGTWANGDLLTIPFTYTEADPADITVAFSGLANGAVIGNGGTLTWDLTSAQAETITGYASSSTVKALANDGYPSGVLRSLAIEKDGTITGFFTNGQTASLGQIALGDFPNPWGLKKMGSNLFSATLTSGQAIINTPGAGGLGEVTSNALEMANTDLGTEFITMITAQRAYQANAKVITTTDAMMAELMNIKR
ncbi:MAG: Flagellar hook protein FlgE [Syntrophaceae bacterium PtaB.Bin038]|nr:MAG: Flagellar hook protein FlgE [Syntrophaceae bacterium PtaB.Bin038]